jgi:hypothetical protein
MTVVYPKDGKQDFSFHLNDDFKVVESSTMIHNYTMGDDVVLHVSHDNVGSFNYSCYFRGTTHNFYTVVDTTYHSENLKKIIENCIIYERLWV